MIFSLIPSGIAAAESFPVANRLMKPTMLRRRGSYCHVSTAGFESLAWKGL
jgi:hypothetical protein